MEFGGHPTHHRPLPANRLNDLQGIDEIEHAVWLRQPSMPDIDVSELSRITGHKQNPHWPDLRKPPRQLDAVGPAPEIHVDDCETWLSEPSEADRLVKARR